MIFNVVHVIDNFNSGSGGPPRVVTTIARAGAGAWRAQLLTTDFTESARDRLLTDAFPGPIHLLPSRSRRPGMLLGTRIGLPSRLRTGFGAARPDLLHLHGLWSPLLAAAAELAQRARIPYIVAPHGMLEPWSLGVHRLRKRFALRTFQGRVLARAAAIHATSNAEAEHVRRLEVTAAPIFVVPNIVDEPVPPSTPGRADGERKLLLFLSRIHEKKGLGLLLQAWETLRPADWELKIVGNGAPAYVQQLEALCAARHLPNVAFEPHADGARREALFGAASAFVLPTFSENFGIVIAEALIRGVPVITTTGTPWAVVASRQLGWYIEPTAGELTRCLADVFRTDAATLREIGVRGRDYAREHLVEEAVLPRLLDMYRQSLALDMPRGPAAA